MRSPRLAAALLPVALAACETAGGSSVSSVPRQPRQVVVVLDLSGSQASHALRESREYLERTIESLSYGDQLVLLEMQRRRANEDVRRYVHDMPLQRAADFESSADRDELTGARDALHAVVPIFFDSATAGTIANTDLLSTLRVAEEYLRDAGSRRKQIVLLSDMLQSSGDLEFAGARQVPPSSWIDARRDSGLVADLADACVVVIGADASDAPGVRVRAFWSAYFAAAGADLRPEHYRLIPPGAPVDCAA